MKAIAFAAIINQTSSPGPDAEGLRSRIARLRWRPISSQSPTVGRSSGPPGVARLDEIMSSIPSPRTETMARWTDITRTGWRVRSSAAASCALKKGFQPSSERVGFSACIGAEPALACL